jgi:hypothetical protein
MKFIQNWIRKLLLKIANRQFVRNAIDEQSDLSAFKKRPTIRIMLGVTVIALSYIIGWPLITLLGKVAINMNAPMVLAVGGPTAYGVSHLVFLLGMYLTGTEYSIVFLRWATRVTISKLLSRFC